MNQTKQTKIKVNNRIRRQQVNGTQKGLEIDDISEKLH